MTRFLVLTCFLAAFAVLTDFDREITLIYLLAASAFIIGGCFESRRP